MLESDDNVVRFTVKELLAKMDAKLDAIGLAIHAKADHATVEELEHRVSSLERWRSLLTGGYAVVLLLLGALVRHFL